MYLVGFVCGGLHLLIDPALELIRVTEKLLQMEGVLQGGTAGLSTIVQGIASAQQLKQDLVVRVNEEDIKKNS